MASDWYVSSAAWTALPQFAASGVYTVGQIVRPLTAPALGKAHAFRCTTAGTASTEPTWPTANNSTVTTGGATFTNVTGQSAYFWTAAAGDLWSISSSAGWNRPVVGDRVFLSSDHAESLSAANGVTYTFGSAGFGLIQIMSVNRGGSTPPVAADLASGAAITTIPTSGNSALTLECLTDLFWQGVTFTLSGSLTSAASINLTLNGRKAQYFKNCAFVLANTAAGVGGGLTGGGNGLKTTLDNTTVQFGVVGQTIGGGTGAFDLTWINTSSAIQGSVIPTNLFFCPNGTVTCRGVDFSAATGILTTEAGTGAAYSKVLLESCKIASGATRLFTPTTSTNAGHEIELINCYDGTNVINERWTPVGNLVTDRSTYLTSGAQDDIGNYSFKLVSNANSDFCTLPATIFGLDVENTLTGASHTATVEIISSGTLNNNDIRLLLEHMGTVTTYTTWNPVDLVNITLSNGNLTELPTGNGSVRGLFPVSSGKYYFEFTFAISGAFSSTAVGIANASATLSSVMSTGTSAAICNGNGAIAVNGSAQTGIAAFLGGGVCCVALDVGAALIWFRNGAAGNWNGSGTANPATGTGGYSISGLTGGISALYALAGGVVNGAAAITANFGASAFTGSAPSGFVGWPANWGTLASFADSLPSVLTAASALPSSSNTWNSPPATPQKQLLQVSFTPQRAGRVRGLVRLGKPSTTVWVNPQVKIT